MSKVRGLAGHGIGCSLRASAESILLPACSAQVPRSLPEHVLQVAAQDLLKAEEIGGAMLLVIAYAVVAHVDPAGLHGLVGAMLEHQRRHLVPLELSIC